MNRMMALGALLLALVPCGNAIGSEESLMTFLSVQDLYDSCNMKRSPFLYAECYGYTDGIVNMMDMIGASRESSPVEKRKFGACLPPSPITTEQLVQIFKNWAEKHPEQWSEQMGLGVLYAIRETWPCAAVPGSRRKQLDGSGN